MVSSEADLDLHCFQKWIFLDESRFSRTRLNSDPLTSKKKYVLDEVIL